ncbi:hypothetical protein [Chryseobacterium wanjuense]
MERDQTEELRALQDTLYFIGGSGGFRLSILFVTATGVSVKLNEAYPELLQECSQKN